MYCGGGVVEGAPPTGEVPCPRCRALMTETREAGLDLDVCGTCGGTWYDRGELEARLERRRQEPPPLELDGPDPAAPGSAGAGGAEAPALAAVVYRTCPRCEGQMQRRAVGGRASLIIDVCGRHGVFLDAGELERIIALLARGASVKGVPGQAAPPDEPEPEAELPPEAVEVLARAQADLLADRFRAEDRAERMSQRAHGLGTAADLLSSLFD